MRNRILYILLFIFSFAIASAIVGNAFIKKTVVENYFELQECEDEKDVEKDVEEAKDFEKEKIATTLESVFVSHNIYHNKFSDYYNKSLSIITKETDINPPECKVSI